MNRNRLCLFYIHIFNSHLTSCFVYYSSLLLRRCCRRCPLAMKSPTVPLLIHTYIHLIYIHMCVCVSSICLYLPHRPHILDGTNRVLSCLFYLAYFQRMAFCVLKMFCILCNIAKEWKRDRQYVSVRGEKSKEFQSISTDFVSHPTI